MSSSESRGLSTHSAPQSAADRLRDATSKSSLDRGFLVHFIGVCLGFILVGTVASYVLNPYGRFSPTVFAPRVPLDRDEKAALWRSTRPSVVIVGSSHVKKLNPSCVTRLTGLPTFNFGVDGGSLDDIRAIIDLIEGSQPLPEQLIIGIETNAFSSIKGVARPTMWSRVFSEHVPSTLENKIDAIAEMLWSQEALMDDIAVARRGVSRTQSHRLRSDGFMETPNEDEQRRSARYDLEGSIRISLARMYPIYSASNFDPGRFEIFRRLMEGLHGRGIKVLAFTPPLHPSLSAALAKSERYVSTRASFERAMGSLEHAGLLRFYNVDLNDFDGSPSDFLDVDHMNEVNTAKLLGHLYGRPHDCAVQ